MAALPLPTAILDDFISGSGNVVIQDGGRKWKGSHFAAAMGSKSSPYTTMIFIRIMFSSKNKETNYVCIKD